MGAAVTRRIRSNGSNGCPEESRLTLGVQHLDRSNWELLLGSRLPRIHVAFAAFTNALTRSGTNSPEYGAVSMLDATRTSETKGA